MVYDFHTHTHLSDGVLSPDQLIREAIAIGYKAIAVTDHVGLDDQEAILETLINVCALATKNLGIIAVPGVELTQVAPSQIDHAAKKAKSLGAKIVLVHGGGYLPFQAGRIDQGYQTLQGRPSKLRRGSPSDYLSLLYYDTVAMSPQAIRMIRDIAGADHIVLGSDYVFSGPEGSLMEPVERAGLTSSEVASVCCQNALRLFFKED